MKQHYMVMGGVVAVGACFVAGIWLAGIGTKGPQEPEIAQAPAATARGETPPEVAPERVAPPVPAENPRRVLTTLPIATPGIVTAGRGGAAVPWIPAGYDDRQNMMDQLGIRVMRPGKNGSNQNGPGFDEATANDWMPTMPQVLVMKDGTKVTTPELWARRRLEILEDFEREIYGRIPTQTPTVLWRDSVLTGGQLGTPTKTHMLIGQVDNSAFPQITVNIRVKITVPTNTNLAVPLLLEFGSVSSSSPTAGGGRGTEGGGPSWHLQALRQGWAYGSIEPTSIQADNGGNNLRQGIIGLCNKGEPRKPDDWGAFRAWQWGVSRLIDFLETRPEFQIDARQIAVEGLSRYGKAALVTEAFDSRVAAAFVASSGAGGAKLLRHDYGEALENLTAGEYYWFAGNLLKYGAADIQGNTLNASNLPVDGHELLALCAPRPCFISYGVESAGDPKWVDTPGSYRAGILATPVYELLGKKGYGDLNQWVTAELPPVGTLVGGELAFRQHSGGHTATPNFPTFFAWVGQYIKSPAAPGQ